jgi:Tol biopolymer transport system component/predicted Ser/Thr protein kinase
MVLPLGSILHDRYRIDGQLGKGGMGAVYLAFDQTLQIRVALKENLNPNPESERQFQREATLLASLRHPNLPRVTDHFVLEQRQYLVMDYIEGVDLHTRIANQPASVREVMAWADSLCDALAYLHSRQPPVIHRDIKPANIKLQPDGNVVLVDFGIAKVFDHAQTSTGARGLTPGFSPPEQYGGQRTDARSDQYALAATIYTLLTRRPPVDSIARMLEKEPLVPIRSLNPSVTEVVDAAITRALSLQQSGRFADISTFRKALKGETAQIPVVQPTLKPEPAEPPRRNMALFAGMGAIGVLGLLGVVAVALLLIFRPFSGGTAAAATATSPPATAAPPAAIPTATLPPSTPVPATAAPTSAPTEEPTLEPTTVPVLAGGGGQIAFVTDREDGHTLQVWLMNPDGSSPRQLTFGPGDKTQPRWSPDGTRLLYVAPGGGDASGGTLGTDIWVINLDGSAPTDLTQSVGDETDPVWSPDGSRIAFTSDRINDLDQVFISPIRCDPIPASCTVDKPFNLSAGFAVESSPAWSPDGRTIAVSASINGAPGRIFLRSPTPGEPTKFDRRDRIIGAYDLAWSPDSKLLAFTWRQPTMNEVYLAQIDAPGADPTRLTDSLGNKEASFSPDGNWIVFTSTRDQNPEVYIMAISGAGQENLTKYTGRDMQPAWQPPVKPSPTQ